jgi:hypothetical protein
MAQTTQLQQEAVAQLAGRILSAGRMRANTLLKQELERARSLTAQTQATSTFEMERLEALSGAVEALQYGYDEGSGAVRLLEHLAIAGTPREAYSSRHIN